MAAPTYVQEAESSFNAAGSTHTTGSFDALAGDVLVAIGIAEDQSYALTISNNGTALTWTEQQQVNVGSNCRVYVWTTVLAGDRTGLTVSVNSGNASSFHAVNVTTWRDSDGVGASSKTNASGAPSLGLTTTEDNSAIVIGVGDWNAVDGTSRTWRSVNGSAATELLYFRDSSHLTAYAGRHGDAGTAGAKTVGLSAPSGQKYSIVAVEVLGTAGGGGAQSVAPSSVAPANGVGQPTLTPGAVSVAPGGVTPQNGVGEPTLTVGAVSIAPGSVAPANGVGDPSLVPGAVSVAPGGVAPGNGVGEPSVVLEGQPIEPPGVVPANGVGDPTVVPGSVTVAPGGVAPANGVGDPALSPGSVTVAPGSVDPANGVGGPTVAPGAVAVSPSGVAPQHGVGFHTVSGGEGAGASPRQLPTLGAG